MISKDYFADGSGERSAHASRRAPARIERVTSSANQTLKTLRSLDTKKARAETGLFLVEGARSVLEAQAQGWLPTIIALTEDAGARPALADFLASALESGTRVVETTPALLASITHRDNAQSLVAAYRQRLASLDDIDTASPIVVALESVRDPGNLGTIIRTADATGAAAIILIGTTCDPFSLEAVRASMGSHFSVPLVKADFASFQAWCRAHGRLVVGTHLQGSLPHHEVAFGAASALLMGNEQSGLPEDMARACDALVRIPMVGRADSLNLAISTGVMLYEMWRRGGYAGGR